MYDAEWRGFLYAAIRHMVCDKFRARALSLQDVFQVLQQLRADEDAHLNGEVSSAVLTNIDNYIKNPDDFFHRMMDFPESFRCWSRLELPDEYAQYVHYAAQPLRDWINQTFVAGTPLCETLQDARLAMQQSLTVQFESLGHQDAFLRSFL